MLRASLSIIVALSAVPALAQDRAPAPERAPPPPSVNQPVAVLRTLDKITGRVQRMEVPVNQDTRFGTLDILVRTCRQRPPVEPPESAAFLEIQETKPGEPKRALFSGWMFASSPALSALHHPVYDVWVIDCKSAAPATSRTP
jgi:hypothetical protein